MDFVYKDIHIQLHGKDIKTFRCINSEIKIYEDRIIYLSDNGFHITENVIIIPMVRGTKIIID